MFRLARLLRSKNIASPAELSLAKKNVFVFPAVKLPLKDKQLRAGNYLGQDWYMQYCCSFMQYFAVFLQPGVSKNNMGLDSRTVEQWIAMDSRV